MGASISLESKYRLILGVEVECISAGNIRSDDDVKNQRNNRSAGSDRDRDNDSGSDSGSGGESGGESDSGSDSGSDSDGENKTYTVKITPEIAGYIRGYLRKNTFLDEFDLITEIELEKYEHAPGSALVFNSDSVVYITNNQTIESVGEWEYIEPEPQIKTAPVSKNKKHRRRGDDDHDDDNEDSNHRNRRQYKTKDDSLPVGEIRNILTEKFDEYNKTREFVIHQGKNSFLVLLITSVDIQEV